MMPLTDMILGDGDPTLSLTDENQSESYIISTWEDGSFILYEPTNSQNGTISYMTDAGGSEGDYGGAIVEWSHEIKHENGQESQASWPQVLRSDDGFVLCEGTQWVLLNSESGIEIEDERSSMDCILGLRDEYNSNTNPSWENCDGHEVPQDWRLIGNIMSPIPHLNDFEGSQECIGANGNWQRMFPESYHGVESIILVEEIGNHHFLIVSSQWAGMVVYPEVSSAAFGSELADVETTWEKSLDGDEMFTSATYGSAPGNEISGHEKLLVLGTSEGSVTGWTMNMTTGNVESDSSMKFDSRDAFNEPIRGLLLADCCNGGSNDLWIVEGDQLRIFMYEGLIEKPLGLKISGSNQVNMSLHTIENPDHNWEDGILLIERNGGWVSTIYDPSEFQPEFAFVIDGVGGVSWAEIVALVIAISLMIALIKYPEWYVVNTVGILVGAGVITILGVSFDEWLIILFMVLAACYDAWAVYKSKHMLELADTMIGLKLPILLVAPQDKEYSFLDEGENVMADRDEVSKNESTQSDVQANQPRPIKKGGEAMFMGLGDVIFPGMLCISAMTWLPEMSGPLGWAASTWVALGTMIGGLFGYLWLMTYVARGKPQAGLPLLNGGAILGYVISAMIFVGSSAFEFNISLF